MTNLKQKIISIRNTLDQSRINELLSESGLKSPTLNNRIEAANTLGEHKIMSAYLELCWLAFTDLDKDASKNKSLGRISGYKALKQLGCPNTEQLERIKAVCADEERVDVLKEFRRILSSFPDNVSLMATIRTIDQKLTQPSFIVECDESDDLGDDLLNLLSF